MNRAFRVLAVGALLFTLPTSAPWTSPLNPVQALFARATPSWLPPGGGTVVVTGRTKFATTCSLRVLSTQSANVTLPAPKTCIKGTYSARLTVGPNPAMAWRSIRMALVARGNGTASVAFYVNLNPKELPVPSPAATGLFRAPPPTPPITARPPPSVTVIWLGGSVGTTTWTGDPPMPIVASSSGPDDTVTLSAEGVLNGQVAQGYLSVILDNSYGAYEANQNSHGLAEITFSIDVRGDEPDISPSPISVVYTAEPFNGTYTGAPAQARVQITKASRTTTARVIATTTTVSLSATLEPSTCQGSSTDRVCTYAVTATMDTTGQNGIDVTALGNYTLGLYTDGSLSTTGRVATPTMTYQFGAVMNQSVTLYVSARWTNGGYARDFDYKPSSGTSNTLRLPD